MNMSTMNSDYNNNQRQKNNSTVELQDSKSIESVGEEILLEDQPKKINAILTRKQSELPSSLSNENLDKIEILKEQDTDYKENKKVNFAPVVVAQVSEDDIDEEEPSTVISVISESQQDQKRIIVKKKAPLPPPRVTEENELESEHENNDDTDNEETKSILSEDKVTEFEKDSIKEEEKENKEEDEKELEEENEEESLASQVILNSVISPSNKEDEKNKKEEEKVEANKLETNKKEEEDKKVKKPTMGTIFLNKVFGKKDKNKNSDEQSSQLSDIKSNSSLETNSKGQNEEMKPNDTITLENTVSISSGDDSDDLFS